MNRVLVAMLFGAVLAACGGSDGSPAPQPTPPDGAGALLRLETQQALPPEARFAATPVLVVTLDGRALMGGAIPLIFPGPAVNPIVARPISEAGWSAIVELVRSAGLLDAPPMLGEVAPGGEVLQLTIVADGVVHRVAASNQFPGCLTEPCQGAPGTPQAFFAVVSRLLDLGTFLGPEIGPEAPYAPEAWAVLVGGVPDGGNMVQQALPWPFEAGIGAFGEPFADGSGFRCGTVTGEDAATLATALDAATQITPWRDPVDGTLHGLTVRPLLPGDPEPCAGIT